MARQASARSTAGRAVTARNRAGVLLAGLLALTDVGFFLAGAPGAFGVPAGNNPVTTAAALLGIVTLLGGGIAWGRDRRGGLRVAAVSRVLTVLSAVPAFFFEGVPAPVVVIAAVTLLLTMTAVVLLLSRR